MRHVTVEVLKLRQLQSQGQPDAAAAAKAVGCSPTWKDEFTHGMVPSTLSKGGSLIAAPRVVSLCRYRATTADLLMVTYVAGRRLTAKDTAALFAAITGPGKRGGCSKGHDGILLAFDGPDPLAQIELGGCSRVIRDDVVGHESIGTTDSSAVALLEPH